jgi:thiol-disulfide isomerase/thioredoxin
MALVSRAWYGWRFVRPYYILNVAVLALYGAARAYWLPEDADIFKPDATGVTREGTVLMCLTIVCASRLLSAPSLDAWFGTFFLFARVAVTALLFMSRPGLVPYFALTWAFVWLAARQPAADDDAGTFYLNHNSLRTKAMTGRAVKWSPGGDGRPEPTIITDPAELDVPTRVWVVEFYTNWSPPCVQFAPVYADLAASYGNGAGLRDGLNFAKLDLTRWQSVAADMGIDVRGTSTQLPTIVVFEEGVEVARVPPVAADGTVTAVPLTRSNIVKGLSLDYFYARARAKATRDKGTDDTGKDNTGKGKGKGRGKGKGGAKRKDD